MDRPPIIERAYEIADSGRIGGMSLLRKVLIKEGYAYSDVAIALNGLAVRRSLQARIVASARASTA